VLLSFKVVSVQIHNVVIGRIHERWMVLQFMVCSFDEVTVQREKDTFIDVAA
jgi:hypothetical protein